jgi:hypothetical protein
MCKIKQLAVVLAIVIMSSCSGIRVSQDYDFSTAFTQYKTFAPAPEPSKKSGDVLMDSPLIDQRILKAIENTLTAKGFTKTDHTRSDFYVAYQIIVKTRIEADTVPGYGWGVYPYGYRRHYYPYWGDFGYETYVRQYEEATLIIDFMDSRTRKLFWRGVGSRRIYQQSSPEKLTAWVNQFVSEILAQYPPLPAGR